MMNHTTKYLLSGAAATIPMSLAMAIMYQSLPPAQKYPLPPRKITMNVAEEVGVKYFLDESEKESLTLLSHFAYGAVTGALYFPLARKLRLKDETSGMGYGLLVWAVSYFGILPSLKLHQSPLKMPTERNALMIAAHLVWGRSLALMNKVI